MHSLGSQSLSPKPMGAWPNPAPMSQAEPSGLLPVEPWSPHPDQVSRPLKQLKGMTRAPGSHKNFQGAEWGKEAPPGRVGPGLAGHRLPHLDFAPLYPCPCSPQGSLSYRLNQHHSSH